MTGEEAYWVGLGPEDVMERSIEEARANRCGHNFPPRECPYTPCGYRQALEECERLAALLADDLIEQDNERLRERLEKCETALKLIGSEVPFSIAILGATVVSLADYWKLQEAARAAVEE